MWSFKVRGLRQLFHEEMFMRRIVALALASSLLVSAPLFAARAPQGQAASLSGEAKGPTGETLANSTVQLRNVNTGQLVGTTTSNATGAFTFSGLPAGTYAVEVLNAAGQIVGTSAAVSVTAGAAVTGVTVGATAAGVAAGAAAGGGISTAVVVTTVAVVAGVAGTVAIVRANASPSR
jgi:hypothetical protein